MKRFLSFFLALAIILISSVVALADSSDVVDSAGVFPIGLYEDKALDLLSSGSTRASITLEDIYNALFYNNISVGNYQFFIANTLARHFSGTDGRYIDSILNNIDTKATNLISIDADIANKTQTTNAKLEYIFNAVEDTINIKWYNSNAVYSGTSLGKNSNMLSSYTSGNNMNVFYRFTSTVNPSLVRVALPLSFESFANQYPKDLKLSVSATTDYATFYQLPEFDYFFEISDTCWYVYLFDFKPFTGSWNYCFTITSPSYYYFIPAGYTSVWYIPFDTIDYQQIKSAFYQMKSANNATRDSDNIQALKDVYASPDLIQAKQNQQSVENQVISDFTGQGTESMSLNDVGGVKNVSSNAKQFLGTGSSGSNALSVFNVNGQGLWQWFSQTTADNLDTTSPTRSSDGYLSIYDQNMQNYLDGLGGVDNAR